MLTATANTCEGTTLDACQSAIRDAFAGAPGRVDIRHLWTRGETHNFRVNWWRLRPDSSEYHIARSEFVTVDMMAGFAVVRPPLTKTA